MDAKEVLAVNPVRYARAPGPNVLAALQDGGPLAFLRSLPARPAQGIIPSLRHDVHFREGDVVSVYVGMTRPLRFTVGATTIKVDAASSYRGYAPALFRTWQAAEWGGIRAAALAYLNRVVVDASWLRAEGVVQDAWSAVSEPWVPIDREAVIGRAQSGSREIALVRELRMGLTGRLKALAKGEKVSCEVDQIGVDASGALVLAELKDSRANPVSVYGAPLQVLQYVHEWALHLPAVTAQVQALVDARAASGLAAQALPRLSGRLRPAICFTDDKRSDEVRSRFEEVLAAANAKLPAGVERIEVWKMGNGKPERIG